MRTQRIEMLEPREVRSFLDHPLKEIESQIVWPTNYHTSRLIARLCWRVLLWLCPQRKVPDIKIDYVTVQGDDFLRLLDEQQYALRRVWAREAKYLIVGRDEYERIRGEVLKQRLAFYAESQMCMDGAMGYRGLNVICVPWMSGWCLLDELKKAPVPCDSRAWEDDHRVGLEADLPYSVRRRFP